MGVTIGMKPLICGADLRVCTGVLSSEELVIRFTKAGINPHLYFTTFVHGTGINLNLDQCSIIHASIRNSRVE